MLFCSITIVLPFILALTGIWRWEESREERKFPFLSPGKSEISPSLKIGLVQRPVNEVFQGVPRMVPKAVVT